MEVTSVESQGPLTARVLAELKQIRKRRGGIDVGSVAGAPTICALLGGGDPYIAYNRVMHHILDSALDTEVQAAAASLGFGSDGKNHLERLSDFGEQVGMDQRHVRRLSDSGLLILARLICTNWPTETVPELRALVSGSGADAVELLVTTRHLSTVAMRVPRLTLTDDEGARDVAYESSGRVEGMWNVTTQSVPVRLALKSSPMHIDLVWRGELWPKLSATGRDLEVDFAVEVLGNKMRVSIDRRGFLPGPLQNGHIVHGE